MVGVLASVGVAALTLAANETFAGSTGGGRGGVAAAPVARPAIALRPAIAARSFAHHRRSVAGGLWPAGYGGVPYYGEPVADAGPPVSNDVNYTYTYKYDVPWDWAHRYPPNVVPSDRPYVPGCSSEPVRVFGRGGGQQTVNVIRCY
jgi:hypothetical protein